MTKRLAIITAVIFIFTLLLQLMSFHDAVPLKKSFDNFPLHWKGWAGSSQTLDTKVLDMLRMNEYLNMGYQRGGDKVGMYVGYYATQKEGGQIHSPKLCLPASGWDRVSEQTEKMNINGFGNINVVRAVYQKDGQKEIFVYWYQMKNASIADEYKLRIYRFLNSIRYGRNDAAFIRISVPVTSSEEKSVALLKEFMQNFLPLLRDYLPE